MKGTWLFLKKCSGRGILLGMLTVVLLRLTGADAAALAQNCGQWSVVPSPSVGSSINVLYGVTAISPNDVWAVGTSASATLTEHWNGTQWSVVKSPSIGTYYPTLFSVTAISTNDVWAVGSTLYHDRHVALIEHWDGTSWSMVSNPPPSRSCLPVFGGVTAISSGDVWTVGSDWGNCYDSPPYALTEHWNGTQWKVVHTPSNKGTLTGQLNAVAAASTNNVWAVGSLYDQQQASTYHWDGTRWSNIANPILPFSYLYGVAVTSAGDFWAVGSYSPPNSNAQTVIEFYC